MFFLAFFKKILYIANIVIIEIFEMRVCVKYNDNFWFNKLMRFIVFIYTNRSLTNCISSHTHTHTHTHIHTHAEILHYNYILFISIWELCKNDFE
ncbi:MAG: hypothetical protein BWX59_01649 [Bacteroidetes bacterium ADurb.Bin028]|jgi:hypothetical protein|nr:MAG: hypothetical protein BWX59_01649 [Bacteroidetes bacterium ADurb.Bin028]